jgi:hypothetical protein
MGKTTALTISLDGLIEKKREAMATEQVAKPGRFEPITALLDRCEGKTRDLLQLNEAFA